MNNLISLGGKENVNLKDYCTFKIGGNANYLFKAKSILYLLNVCRNCKLHNIRYKVIGSGANLLFSDNGYNGAIIINQNNKIHITENIVIVGSGFNLTAFIIYLSKHNLSGIENLSGIPATIGGAIVNNVSSYNTCITDFVEYVECYKKTNLYKKLILHKQNCNFKYRESIFSSGEYIITKACFKFKKDSYNLINERIQQAIKTKVYNQPLDFPSAGSIFKRSNIIPSKVIDELGLKGIRVGDAEISTKHAGFIVNVGNAKCEDVLDLVSLIKEKVLAKYHEKLETEIEIVK